MNINSQFYNLISEHVGSAFKFDHLLVFFLIFFDILYFNILNDILIIKKDYLNKTKWKKRKDNGICEVKQLSTSFNFPLS